MADRIADSTPLERHHATDAEALVRIVDRHRRRLLFITLLSHIGTGGAVAMAFVSTGLVPAGALPRAALVTAAVGVAAVIAWLRAPDLRATGRQLDRRLGLADHVVAGLDLRTAPSGVAPLVVRGAIARVASASPRQVFPFRMPWHTRAAVAVAVMAIVWGIVFQPSGSEHASERRGSLLQAVLEPPPGAPVPDDAVVAPADVAVPGAVPVPDAAVPGQGTDMSPRSQDRVEDRPGTDATERDRDALARSPDGGAGGEGRAAAGREAGAWIVRTDEAAAETRDVGAGDGGDGASGASSGDSMGQNAGAGSGGEVELAASGGVSGAQAASLEGSAAARGASSTAEDRAGSWRRAEAALASGAIPPRLRQYVRAYFNAIREP